MVGLPPSSLPALSPTLRTISSGVAKKVRAALVSSGFLASSGALILCGAFYFYLTEGEEAMINGMCQVFESGGLPGWERKWREDSAALARPGVDLGVREVLFPSSPLEDNWFVVIVGATGTGKSTAVRRAILGQELKIDEEKVGVNKNTGEKTGSEGKEVEKGGGVGVKKRNAVYFLAPTRITSFSTALMATLNYHEPFSLLAVIRRLVTTETKEQTTRRLKEEPIASWAQLAPALEKAARRFTEKHKRPPVLVLDAMDLVAKEAPGVLSELLNFAKECADSGLLRFVFVFSDGQALPLLTSNSAVSRSMEPFEVGDVSNEIALEYLRSRDVEESRAKDIVERVAGGRFILLRQCASSKDSVDDMVAKRHNASKKRFRDLGVPPSGPFFAELLKHGFVNDGDATTWLSKGDISGLLEGNLLSAHPNGTYTFHSRHVASFCALHAKKNHAHTDL